jgi:hypothetical protein
MSIWDGIAAVGQAGRGFDAASERDYALRRDEAQRKLTDLAVANAIRKDQDAAQLRAVQAQISPRAAAQGLGFDKTVQSEIEPDSGVGLQRETAPGSDFGASADSNRMARVRAAADLLENRGDFEGADRYHKALKAMEDEGYKAVVVGIASGKSPQEIAAQFNEIGSKRIVGGMTDGKTYKFKYEDGTEGTYERAQMRRVATDHGFLRKPETKIVPAGATETIDGEPVYRSPEKAMPPQKIDPYSPAGIEAQKTLADYKEKVKGQYANKSNATAMEKNVNRIAEEFGVSWPEAYEKSRVGMSAPEHEKVLDVATRLKAAEGLSGKYDGDNGLDLLMGDARSLVRQAKSGSTTRGGPEQLSGPGSEYTPPKSKDYGKSALPSGFIDTGRLNPAGKRIVRDPAGQLVVEE